MKATQWKSEGPLYSDQEAVALKIRANALIPDGGTLPRREALSRLGIDPRRLRDRWVECINRSYIERWRLSEKYDLVWTATVVDQCWPTSDDRQEIFRINVTPTEDLGRWMRAYAAECMTGERH